MKFPFERFIKFSLVGSLGLGVGLLTIYICVEYLSIAKAYAWFVSTAVTILFNFSLNNLFTWRDRPADSLKKTSKRFGLYYFFNGLSIVINYTIYRVLLSLEFHYILAALGGVALATLLNFFWADRFIWRPKHQTD